MRQNNTSSPYHDFSLKYFQVSAEDLAKIKVSHVISIVSSQRGQRPVAPKMDGLKRIVIDLQVMIRFRHR